LSWGGERYQCGNFTILASLLGQERRASINNVVCGITAAKRRRACRAVSFARQDWTKNFLFSARIFLLPRGGLQ
jgi:hypothetical protein